MHSEVKSCNHFQALIQADELLLTTAIVMGTTTTRQQGNIMDIFLL